MKVSIIIPVYNVQRTIKKAIDSALNQDFPKKDFEVIVVNDGSTDKTLEILKKYKKKIKLICQKNQGAIKAANRGFKAAQGKYIIKLDADDYFGKDILKKMSASLEENPQINFVYCNYYEKLKNGRIKINPVKNIFQTLACTVMYRREDLKRASFYKEIKLPEYDILLSNQAKWKSFHLKEPLYHFNRSKKSLSGKRQWVKEAIEELRSLHPDKIKEIKKIRKF